MTHEVRLEVFEGPIDLLLHLITRQRVDIYEVSIAEITDEYLKALGAMEGLDLEAATGFLVVAATLLELKSIRLLPAPDRDNDGDLALLEERDLLLARLVECATFREAGAWLFAGLQRGTNFHARPRCRWRALRGSGPRPAPPVRHPRRLEGGRAGLCARGRNLPRYLSRSADQGIRPRCHPRDVRSPPPGGLGHVRGAVRARHGADRGRGPVSWAFWSCSRPVPWSCPSTTGSAAIRAEWTDDRRGRGAPRGGRGVCLRGGLRRDANERKIIESILLLADEPVPASLIGEVLERPEGRDRGAPGAHSPIPTTAEDRGFVLREVAGGWRLYTTRIPPPGSSGS